MKFKKSYRTFLAATASSAAAVSAIVAAGPVATLAAEGHQNHFTDIEKLSTEAKEAISNLAASEVVNGFQDHTFRPHQAITREQAAVMFVRAFNLNTSDVTNPGFADVPQSHTYYKEIAAAVEAGIFAANTTNFNGKSTFTRGEAAGTMSAAWELTGEPAYTFSDNAGAYENAVARLADAGIIKGYGDNSFRAGASLSRVDFALLLNRAMTQNGIPAQFTAEASVTSVSAVSDDNTLVVTFNRQVTEEELDTGDFKVNHYNADGELIHVHAPAVKDIDGKKVTFTDFDLKFAAEKHDGVTLHASFNGTEEAFVYYAPSLLAVDAVTAITDDNTLEVEFNRPVTEEDIEIGDFKVNHYNANGELIHVHTPALYTIEGSTVTFIDFDLRFAPGKHDGITLHAQFNGEETAFTYEAPSNNILAVHAVVNDDTLAVTFAGEVSEEALAIGDFKVNHYNADGELIHVHTPSLYTIEGNTVTFAGFDLAFAAAKHDGVTLHTSYNGTEEAFVYYAPSLLTVDSVTATDNDNTLVVEFNRPVTDGDIEIGDFKVNHYNEAGELIHVHTPALYVIEGNTVTFTDFDLAFAPGKHDGKTLHAQFNGEETAFVYTAPTVAFADTLTLFDGAFTFTGGKNIL